MNRKLIILSLTVIFVLFSAIFIQAIDKTPEQLVNEVKAQIKNVSIHEVKQMIDAKEKIILLDIRDKEEFEKGHISGAINISRGQLEFLVEDEIPDKNSRVVVY